MRTLTPILCALALTACGETGRPEAPLPTVDELAADPARLEELRPQCKLDRAKLGDACAIEWPKQRAGASSGTEGCLIRRRKRCPNSRRYPSAKSPTVPPIRRNAFTLAAFRCH